MLERKLVEEQIEQVEGSQGIEGQNDELSDLLSQDSENYNEEYKLMI